MYIATYGKTLTSVVMKETSGDIRMRYAAIIGGGR